MVVPVVNAPDIDGYACFRLRCTPEQYLVLKSSGSVDDGILQAGSK